MPRKQPKTIALISQKGGAGKTTIALNLAVAAETETRHAIILDIDPQASASAWFDNRLDPHPRVEYCPARRLDHTLAQAARDQSTLALIDTGAHIDDATITAARAANLVLIPCRPAMLDLHAINGAVDIARLANTPAVVVINGAPPRGPFATEARTILTDNGLTVLPVSLGHRSAFVHALNAGQGVIEYAPKSKAASEIKALHALLDTYPATKRRRTPTPHPHQGRAQ